MLCFTSIYLVVGQSMGDFHMFLYVKFGVANLLCRILSKSLAENKFVLAATQLVGKR
jgi:hypothetical protein